jgi:Flp pilus assembly protein TadG
MTRRLGRARDERGAVAIIGALVMSAVLIAVAALGVDLGQAWSRRLTVQTSVDVSAISAGALLPASSELQKGLIYQEVADYLNKAGNKVRGQAPLVLATQLHDGVPGNGEVYFTANPGTGLYDTMRVVAPGSDVDFTFAGALGIDDVEVSGEATVQVRTPLPRMQSVLPVWLPSTCVYGPIAADAGSSPPPSASPTYTLNSPRGSRTWAVTAVSPASASYATPGATLDVTISDLPANKLGAVIRFTFGDTQYVDYRVTWPTATAAGDSRTVVVNLDDPAASRVPAGATVTNPDEGWTVTSTAGRWEIWPLIPVGASPLSLPLATPLSGLQFPKEQGQAKGQGYFEVTGGGQVACSDSQRGNFGQLDSPRRDVSQKQTVYAYNVAYGLDHQLTAFPNPASAECSGDGTPTGALIDDAPSQDGRNCLYVDPGNDPQGLTDGMLGGGRVPQGVGRLEKPTNPRCQRTDYRLGSHSYNNDTLSCYLKPGYTLADIAKDDGVPYDALDESIFDSPRFFWVAVVHATDRQLKKYLAIKTFAPVFLTDETLATPATTNNGLVLNAGGKVQSMQVFGFNADALPVQPNADTSDYQDGSRKVVRLVG